jgi:hypothetical protein
VDLSAQQPCPSVVILTPLWRFHIRHLFFRFHI